MQDNTRKTKSNSKKEPYKSTCLDFGGAASNHPLRGGKESFWEGGVRVAAFASGGFIPPIERGTSRSQLIAAADWYSTFAGLAGVDPTDAMAAAHNLPPIDSVDQSGILFPHLGVPSRRVVRLPYTDSRADGGASGVAPAADVGGSVYRTRTASGRTHIVLGKTAIIVASGGSLYKLVVGKVAMDTWVGPRFPNASSFNKTNGSIKDCKRGCLFDVASDPTEHRDIAVDHADVVADLTRMLAHSVKTAFEPSRGAPQQAACDAAHDKYDGHYGPFA